MKKLSLIFATFTTAMCLIASCGSSTNENKASYQAHLDSIETAVRDSLTREKQYQDSIRNNSPEAKVAKATAELSQENHVLGNYNNVIYYLKRIRGGYQKSIYSYDPVADKYNTIPLSTLGSGGSPDYIKLKDGAMNGNNIALIVEDGGRCGSGGALGSTFLPIYNVLTGTFRESTPNRDGCVNAQFIAGGTKIKMTVGYITNEDAEFACDYEYAYKTKIVSY